MSFQVSNEVQELVADVIRKYSQKVFVTKSLMFKKPLNVMF